MDSESTGKEELKIKSNHIEINNRSGTQIVEINNRTHCAISAKLRKETKISATKRKIAPIIDNPNINRRIAAIINEKIRACNNNAAGIGTGRVRIAATGDLAMREICTPDSFNIPKLRNPLD